MYEQREVPFGPRKPDIKTTTKECSRAIQSLREFSERDISIIQTIEDLSAYASLVGEDVRRIVLASDNVKKIQVFPQYPMTDNDRHEPQEAAEIRMAVDDHTLRIVTTDCRTYIDRYETIGTEKFNRTYIVLSVGRDIGVTGNPIVDTFSIYAVDWRNGRNISWHPANYPFDSDVQQGFTRVLQEAVMELLSVVPHTIESS